MKNPLVTWIERLPALKRMPRWAWAVIALLFLGLVSLVSMATSPTSSTSDASGFLETDSPSMLAIMLDIFLKLGLVIALIYASLYALRRWQRATQNRPSRQMAVLETVSLAPRQTLHLVRAGSRVLLIGAAEGGLTCLSEVELLPEGEMQASQETAPASFAALLGTALKTK